MCIKGTMMVTAKPPLSKLFVNIVCPDCGFICAEGTAMKPESHACVPLFLCPLVNLGCWTLAASASRQLLPMTPLVSAFGPCMFLGDNFNHHPDDSSPTKSWLVIEAKVQDSNNLTLKAHC